MELYYANKISADLLAEEDSRLRRQAEGLEDEDRQLDEHITKQHELVAAFDRVSVILGRLEPEVLWVSATDGRRVLVEELLEELTIFPDHLEVVVAGAPRLNVLLEEVGLDATTALAGAGERLTRPAAAAPSWLLADVRGPAADCLGLSVDDAHQLCPRGDLNPHSP